MNAPSLKPWTPEQFLAWVETQEEAYEFDGFRPVAMGDGTWNHDQITANLRVSLQPRLRGTACRAGGPNAGVATIGNKIRYPDAVVTCARFPGDSRLTPGVAIVFEVLSPSSGGTDRVAKLREYQAVASIRRYVILEYASVGLTVFEKRDDGAWSATALTGEDTIRLPEAGLEIPVAEFYEDVEFPAPDVPE